MLSSRVSQHWRAILAILIVLGFFAPWTPSRISPYGNWGNTPHYLVEYDRLSSGLPTGDLGAGYFQPQVYFGFEVLWIYLIGFLHFLGFHTLIFPIGLGAVLVIIYLLFSLSIYFMGNEAQAHLIPRVRLMAFLSLIAMTLGGIAAVPGVSESFKPWHFAGYIVTFIGVAASLALEFRRVVASPTVQKRVMWLRAITALIIGSLCLPMVFVFPSPISATSSTALSDCDVLKGFTVPAARWESLDEAELQAWIEESPNFDNFVDMGSFGNTNELDYRLTWYGYGHEGFYEAYFTAHYLRAVSAHVSNGISVELALECFGEPNAYLAFIEDSDTGFDSLLVQLWYPTLGIVLDNQEIGDHVQAMEMNGQFPVKGIHFVQPGSIEAIAERAYLLDSSWLFPNWTELIKTWPDSFEDIQIVVLKE